MSLIDSHCHLNHAQFSEDQAAVIRRALDAGLSTMLTISTKLEEYQVLEALSDTYSEIYHTVGVHPHYADISGDVNVAETILDNALQHPKAIAVGESGLDYYYDHSEKANQKRFFEMHIALCLAHDVPLIVHTRDADEDTAEILAEGARRGNLKGVLHCFSSGETLAMKGLELGFYISASGIVTFKKSEALREIFKQVPLNRLLIETDAPYLAPPPYRGKRNEPAYVRYIAEQLAALKNVSVESIIAQTSKNFRKLFQLKPL